MGKNLRPKSTACHRCWRFSARGSRGSEVDLTFGQVLECLAKHFHVSCGDLDVSPADAPANRRKLGSKKPHKRVAFHSGGQKSHWAAVGSIVPPLIATRRNSSLPACFCSSGQPPILGSPPPPSWQPASHGFGPASLRLQHSSASVFQGLSCDSPGLIRISVNSTPLNSVTLQSFFCSVR